MSAPYIKKMWVASNSPHIRIRFEPFTPLTIHQQPSSYVPYSCSVAMTYMVCPLPITAHYITDRNNIWISCLIPPSKLEFDLPFHHSNTVSIKRLGTHANLGFTTESNESETSLWYVFYIWKFLSSGVGQCVASWKSTDVSEAPAASPINLNSSTQISESTNLHSHRSYQQKAR